jgi:ribosomal protein S12 methylthiotransferase accessory factor YcaO
MKKIILLLFIPLVYSFSSVQVEQDITLIVSGQGETMEEARASALRSAIEESWSLCFF